MEKKSEGECEICRIYKTAWECINEVRKEEEKALEENRHPLHNFTSEQKWTPPSHLRLLGSNRPKQ